MQPGQRTSDKVEPVCRRRLIQDVLDMLTPPRLLLVAWAVPDLRLFGPNGKPRDRTSLGSQASAERHDLLQSYVCLVIVLELSHHLARGAFPPRHAEHRMLIMALASFVRRNRVLATTSDSRAPDDDAGGSTPW